MCKRILAIVLSIMMIFGISLSAFAENSENPPEMPSGGMTPPDFGDGQPPEKPDGDMTRPGSGNGQRPDKPNGEGPGGHGDAPGGKQSQVEGQLGSWSMGGTDASSVGGDDYAYDSALYVTADGVSQENSATDRISAGT